MSNALDIAKIFIKRGLDTNRNTYDGNMKLQKLLFFADYISISENGKPLFPEPIRAFSNGCVVEEVRLRYKNDYVNLLADSQVFCPDLSQDEYNIINLTTEIFGGLSARELSELNHSFLFWKKTLENSRQAGGYKDKDLAIVSYEDMLKESTRIKEIIKRFNANKSERALKEIINGVTFYYSSDIEMTDELLEQLEVFSNEADDRVYSVYEENGDLVIF
jgi:uncharacterized phage-associated protein